MHAAAVEVVAERVAVAADLDPGLHRLPAAVHRRLRLQARHSRGSCAACGPARAAADRPRRASARRGTGPAPRRTSREREVRGSLRDRRPCPRAPARTACTRTRRAAPAPRVLRASRRECDRRSSLRPPGARRCTNAPAASPTSFAPAFAASSFVMTTLFGLSKVLNALRSGAGDRFAGEHLRRRDVVEA